MNSTLIAFVSKIIARRQNWALRKTLDNVMYVHTDFGVLEHMYLQQNFSTFRVPLGPEHHRRSSATSNFKSASRWSLAFHPTPQSKFEYPQVGPIFP
jgi:hypothetical protein